MLLTTLANGLRVATRAMAGAETAAVALHAETGSRHEPARTASSLTSRARTTTRERLMRHRRGWAASTC